MAYRERVNRAIDYIAANLARGGRVAGGATSLRLKGVAGAAMLSPFHFHRVFQALMGETLADFVKRARLEKALSLMAHGRGAGSRRRGASLAEIARACGFSSASDFSRCFKQQYGASPSRFDLEAWQAEHRGVLESFVKRGSASAAPRGSVPRNPDGFRVRIRDLPARTVAYIRVRDPYRAEAVPQAAARLIAWAQREGLAGGQWLGYQWENPELVPLQQCVYHIAVEIPPARVNACAFGGEIGRFRFPPMLVAQVEVRGGVDLELRALQWLYGTWLPRSGYVPDDHPAFEAFMGLPFGHGMTYFELLAQLPVRRA